MSWQAPETGKFKRVLEVVSKAPARKSKFPHVYGEFYRYMKGVDIKTGQGVDFCTVFEDLDAEDLNPSIYDHIEFTYDKEKEIPMNPSWDKVYKHVGTKGDKKIATNLAVSWRKVGHRTTKAAITLHFGDLTYGEGFALDEELGISITDDLLSFDFTPLLNKVNEEVGLEGWIKISGTAIVVRRKVTREGKEEWVDIPMFGEDSDLTIEGYDLGNLQSAAKEYQVSEAYKEFISMLQSELSKGRMISKDIASMIAKNLNSSLLETLDIEKELRQLTMQPNYDYRCFDALKELSGDKDIYFGKQGFVFELGRDYRVWEVPIPGTATYVFNNYLPIAELISKVEETPRNVIRSEEVELGYLDRVIHAKGVKEADDEESEKYFNRWLADVKDICEV